MPLLVTPSFPFASSSSHCSRWPFHPIRSLPSLFHLLLCPPQRRFAISACLVGHSLPWRGVGGPCLGLHLSCNDAAHCRTIGCSRSGGTWDPCQRNGSHRLPPLLSLSFSPLHDFPSQQTKPAFAARVCKQLQLQSGTWTWLSAESRFSNSHPPPLTLPPTKKRAAPLHSQSIPRPCQTKNAPNARPLLRGLRLRPDALVADPYGALVTRRSLWSPGKNSLASLLPPRPNGWPSSPSLTDETSQAARSYKAAMPSSVAH